MDVQMLIHGICYFDSIAAYITNSFMIYMIINHSPAKLGSYKYLMLSFSSCMLIFPTCHGLLMPHLFINGKSFVFFSEGFLSNWAWAAHFGIVSWAFLFGGILTVVMMQFLYRYLAVIRPHLLVYFSSKKCVIPIGYVLFNSVSWATSVHCSGYHIRAHLGYFRENMMKDYGLAPDNIPMLGLFLATNNSAGEETLYGPEVFAAVFTMTLYWIGFITIGYCTYGIWYHLGRAQLSPKTKRMHRELYKALLIQASVPILADYIPCGITHFLAFFGCEFFGPLFNYSMVCVSTYPVIDPLLVLYFIRDYRAVISRAIRGKVAAMETLGTLSKTADPSFTAAQNGRVRLPPIRGSLPM